MKSNQSVRMSRSLLRKTALLVALGLTIGLSTAQRAEAATNIVVWDTSARFADAVDVADRAGWKAVPTELFAFEADPAKAASDPGYYGSGYSLQWDAAVQHRRAAAGS